MQLTSLLATFLAVASVGVSATKGPLITNKVAFEMEQDGQSLGKITIGLYGKTVPK
ncbi:hypothetical protein BDK51DRAFT_16531, partial [Blyttiomyces helicus]